MRVELAPGTEIAGYRIERVVGRGGMGVVYLAEQRSLSRRVALKVIAPDLAADDGFRARFVREAQLAASLEHPSIIPIHDAGEADGVLFLSMRFVEGLDLDERLDRDGALPVGDTLDVMEQAGGALDAAHLAGLVHRDVKPANILIASGAGVSPQGRVFLTDFGLTKRLDSRSRLTKTGFFLGTVAYAAPEQLQGREVDGRADVYSLVCVLYHCLTGHLPFERNTDPAMVAAHLMDAPPAPTATRPDLPPALDELVRTGMAKSPEDRFPTCLAMVDELRGALGRPGRAPTVAAPPPATVPAPQDPAKPAAAPPPAPVATAPPPPPPPPPMANVAPAAAAARAQPAAPAPPPSAERAPGPAAAAGLALAGALLLVVSALLEVIGGRRGIDNVVARWSVASVAGFTVIAATALAGAVLARRGRELGWGLVGGAGLPSLLIVPAFGVLIGIDTLRLALLDNLVATVGGGLCAAATVVHVLAHRGARLRRSRVALGLSVLGLLGLAVPLVHAFTETSRAELAVAGSIIVPAVVAVLWRGPERPGLLAGVGVFAVAVYAPLLQHSVDTLAPDLAGSVGPVVPGLLGGALTLCAGILEARSGRRRAAGGPPLPE